VDDRPPSEVPTVRPLTAPLEVAGLLELGQRGPDRRDALLMDVGELLPVRRPVIGLGEDVDEEAERPE
jgi:hypothetical protein